MTNSYYKLPCRRDCAEASRGPGSTIAAPPSPAVLLIGGLSSGRRRAPRRNANVLLLAILLLIAGPALPGLADLAAEVRSVSVSAARSAEGSHASTASDTLRIRLALAPRLHVPWARAEIIRPTDASRRDVIVLTPESTLADLEKAIRLLASSHSTQPVPLAHEIRGHVSGTTQQPAPGAMLDALDRGLRALPSGETASISEHGDLPSVELDLEVTIEAPESGS